MSDDDLRRKLIGTSKWRRRKRSVIGKDWTAPTLQDVGAGVWCKKCKIRHPYNGKAKLLCQFERRGSTFVTLWICPKTGDVVGELWPGSTQQREYPLLPQSPGSSGDSDAQTSTLRNDGNTSS